MLAADMPDERVALIGDITSLFCANNSAAFQPSESSLCVVPHDVSRTTC